MQQAQGLLVQLAFCPARTGPRKTHYLSHSLVLGTNIFVYEPMTGNNRALCFLYCSPAFLQQDESRVWPLAPKLITLIKQCRFLAVEL